MKKAADAPVWYGAEQASAWADGYNSALEEMGPVPQTAAWQSQLEEAGKAAIAIRNELDRTRAERDSWEAQFHSAAAAAAEYSAFWEKHQRNFDQFGNYIPHSQIDGDLRAAKRKIAELEAALEPFCGTCREMGCVGEKPSLSVKNDHALKLAAEKALNYIENTEHEFGIKLSCGDALREALK
ncbi:hypothetical protein IVA94_14590 [Bradyrhizobium sp. 156]|uniref:hypothetical protein n=1 Tax=Bradyrhizobium sp. 156 TaxID=2782630 RepID=UPI001FFA39AC|nr:hypothetical protein [Bradyrhizobium sp. 156]MCK1322096.1 hypothetical protein [Bradyrhizobium sp. 156]